MKLLLTLDFPPEKGGIQRYLSGIVRHDFSASDLALVGCGRIEEDPEPPGPASIRRVSTPFSQWNKKFSCIPLLYHFVAIKLAARTPMEIYCGNVYAGCVAWAASLIFSDVEYGVYTYGTELLILKKRSLTRWVLRRVLKKARTVYALGEFTAAKLLEAGITSKPVIVPPRIDYTEPKSAPPLSARNSGGRPGTIDILCVGRLVRHKGHSVLIRALSLLPSTVEWQCVLAGDGPLRQRLMALAVENKVEDRLTIKTDLTDEALWKAYERAAIFVLPSLMDEGAEGFGIVLLEAMARGVPVVASKTGGVPEVLDNGACGILVEPGNAEALAGAIARLHGDASLCRQLSGSARERVRTHYAW